MENRGYFFSSKPQSSLVDQKDVENDQRRFLMFENVLQRRGLPNLAENYSILNTNIQYVENIRKAGDEDFKSLLELEEIEIESILYYGRFSRIFKGSFKAKPVALKVINPNISKNYFEERDMLFECGGERVVKLLASYLDFHTMSPILVQEYCSCSLRQLYAENVSPHLTARFIVQLTEGVAYIHAKNIVHLDMKLENLLIRANGNLVLGDFGFAKRIQPNKGIGATEYSEFLLGTLGYTPIEMLVSKKYSKASDVFSMGAIFVELLSRKMFISSSPEIVKLYLQHPSNNIITFHQDIFKYGIPVSSNLAKRISLVNRLKQLFRDDVIPELLFMIKICKKMLHFESNKRPVVADVLQSEALKRLGRMYGRKFDEEWSPPSPSHPTATATIENIHLDFNVDAAKLRILTSFGFSKIFPEFRKYFEVNKHDQASPQEDLEEDEGAQNSAANESSVTQPASNNDEESMRSSNETVITTGLAGKNPYQTGFQHPLTKHLYIPVDHKALPTGAVVYTCKMIQNSGFSNASNATENRNIEKSDVPERNRQSNILNVEQQVPSSTRNPITPVKPRRGRPRKICLELEIRETFFHCLICKKYQTESRRNALCHIRYHKKKQAEKK